MKKQFLLFLILFLNTIFVFSQSRNIRIGYIDMEYILEKVPDYALAKNQLEEKAQKWKQEIEIKKTEIKKLEESLKTEKVLLTKELLDEREEEIAFQNKELIDFQQKKFGPNGDLIIQKTVLIKPLQDQVFNAVQDIAEAKKYDYVFDKSSDLTILFAAKRLDISDLIVRKLTQLQRREQLSKKEQKAEALKERQQDLIDLNPDAAENQKVLDNKREARQKVIDDRKQAALEKRNAVLEERKKLASERNAKTGTVSDKDSTNGGQPDEKSLNSKIKNEAKVAENKLLNEAKAADNKKVLEEKRTAAEETRKKSLEERQKIIDDGKKAAEEKRLKVLADREAAKKAKEEALKK